MPQDRVLLSASFGSCGLIACLLEYARGKSGFRERWGRRVFMTIHVVLAPLLFIIMLNGAGFMENAVRVVLEHLRDKEGKQMVVVNSPSALLSPYALSAAWNAGFDLPDSFYQLYSGSAQPVVTRVGPNVLEMTVRRGWGGPPIESTVSRPITGVPRLGDRVDLKNMRVYVLEEADNGMPKRVRFEFPTQLESPERIWYTWKGIDLEPWRPPTQGESKPIDAVSPLKAFVQ
jgi:hypothetical protein